MGWHRRGQAMGVVRIAEQCALPCDVYLLRRVWCGSCLALTALWLGAMPAFADSADTDEDDEEQTSWHEKTTSDAVGQTEMWVGSSAVRHVWSIYSGTTWSPFSNLQQDGLRLRSVTSYGQFTYRSRRYDPVTGMNQLQTFRGAGKSVEILGGVQWSAGTVTAKVFAGAVTTEQITAPFDPDAFSHGRISGVKGALELWLTLPSDRWISLDAAYATPSHLVAVRVRGAQKVHVDWAAGGEAAMVTTDAGGMRRLGVFVRFDNGDHEVSAAIGRSWSGSDRGYASVQWMRRF